MTKFMFVIIPNVSNSYVIALPIPVPPPVTIATQSLNNPGLKIDIVID